MTSPYGIAATNADLVPLNPHTQQEWEWAPPLVRPSGEERYWHQEAGVCVCGRQVEFDADTQNWLVPCGPGNPPPFTFWCDDDIGPRGRTIRHQVTAAHVSPRQRPATRP